MKSQPHLLLFGFNESSFKQLEKQIDDHAINVVLIDQTTTETIDGIIAILIDLDSHDSNEKLSFCRDQLPNRPIIGLSNTPIKLNNIKNLLDNIKIVEKPLSEENLCLIIENFGVTRKPQEQQKKQNSIRAVYSNPESTLHYPIKNCFQEYLIKAWKLHLNVKQPIELIFLNKPVLIIYDGKISGSLTNEQLEKLCHLTIQDHSISTLLSTPPKSSKYVEATFFIAMIALWSSDGRLPEGVNSTDAVELLKPKQPHSLPEVEDSQIIHKLWSMEICSLQKTEHVLGVSQSNLFSYFSMLYALDLIEVFSPNTPPSQKKKDNKQTSKKHWFGKNLFSRKKLIPNSL